MPNPDLMVILGAVAALIVGYLFVRYPRWRWHVAIAGVLAAGLGVFLTWYVLFRTDDATYVADKSAAEAQQAELDDLFEGGGDAAGAAVAPKAAPAVVAPTAHARGTGREGAAGADEPSSPEAPPETASEHLGMRSPPTRSAPTP